MPPLITLTPDTLYPDPISPFIYGEFVEFLNDIIPGMWADRLEDRAFAGVLQPRFTYPPGQNWVYPRWQTFVSGRPSFDHWPDQYAELDSIDASARLDLDPVAPFVGAQSARVSVHSGSSLPFIGGMVQNHVAVKQGQALAVEIWLRSTSECAVHVLLGRSYGVFHTPYAEATFEGVRGDWRKYSAGLTPDVTDADASFAIAIDGPGTFWVGRVSLMPQDNRCGWRPDVVDAVRATKPGIIRFGGSSLIYYDWRSGIGPRERRVPFENRPWGNREENDVGLHEFLQFCEQVGAQPLICLNSNSTTIQDILDEIEYCNGAPDTPYGRIRAGMGHPAPFGVTHWQIGNEQSGEEYERRMVDYARAIRARHPDLVLMASYPSENILRNLSDAVDYVCPHPYVSFSPALEAEMRGLVDAIQSSASNRHLKLAITEWNHTGSHWGWGRSWLLTLYNALNAARVFNLYQRMGDWIRIANRSNLINSCCSGSIQTRPNDLYVTPCYHVQKAYANLSGDIALKTIVASGEVLDVSATRHSASGNLTLFAVNPTGASQASEIALTGCAPQAHVWCLSGASLDAVNSFEDQTRIAPTEWAAHIGDGRFSHTFPAYSVTALTFSPA